MVDETRKGGGAKLPAIRNARLERLTPIDVADPSPPPRKKGLAWGWGLVGLVAIWAIANSIGGQPSTIPTQQLADAQAAVEAPAVVAGPSAEDVGTGVRHAGMALGAEGVGGALVYSVNCYAALERTFDVKRLDTCGAFDAATRGAPVDEGGQVDGETSYFAEDTVALRYRSAAARGGIDDPTATARLGNVRLMATGRRLVLVLPPPPTIVEPPVVDDGVGNGAFDRPEPPGSSDFQSEEGTPNEADTAPVEI